MVFMYLFIIYFLIKVLQHFTKKFTVKCVSNLPKFTMKQTQYADENVFCKTIYNGINLAF